MSEGGIHSNRIDEQRDVSEINEALIAMSVRQHELIEDAERARRELLESETFNRSVFEGSPDCVKVLDREGRLLRINHNGLSVMEIDNFEPLNGRPWSDLWPVDKQADVRATLDAARGGREARLQGRCPTFKGNDRWWDIHVSTVRDADGNVVRFIAVSRDVTERVKAELALREANRRKDEFLAMLAHELRNPLAPIRTATEVLKRSGGGGNGQAQHAVDLIERQVIHMVRLVDDLLDVSRVSRGKIELMRKPIDLLSVIQPALEIAQPLCDSQNHDLSVTLPSKPLYVNGDATRLTQAMGNLLNNACKFTEPNGQIRLSVERDAGHAVIRVRDNGIGIAADQLTDIFELFAQVDTSRGRSRGGLGLGLTLVKNLIEMHEGTIEVHSAGIGQGCEFVIRLPIILAPQQQPLQKSTSAENASEAGEAKPKRRVLVVDDNRDVASALSMLVKLGGHQVHTVHDGLAAVEAAEKVQPDMILLDIGLPGIDGYEAARRIRAQKRENRPVLVALSGWGREEDRLQSKEAGFDVHLVKPPDVDALTKILNEWGYD